MINGFALTLAHLETQSESLKLLQEKLPKVLSAIVFDYFNFPYPERTLGYAEYHRQIPQFLLQIKQIDSADHHVYDSFVVSPQILINNIKHLNFPKKNQIFSPDKITKQSIDDLGDLFFKQKNSEWISRSIFILTITARNIIYRQTSFHMKYGSRIFASFPSSLDPKIAAQINNVIMLCLTANDFCTVLKPLCYTKIDHQFKIESANKAIEKMRKDLEKFERKQGLSDSQKIVNSTVFR